MSDPNEHHHELTDMQVYNLYINDVQTLAEQHGEALGKVIEALNAIHRATDDILADTETMRETMRSIFNDEYGHTGDALEWLSDDYEETVRRNPIVEKYLVPAEKHWAEICKRRAADRRNA